MADVKTLESLERLVSSMPSRRTLSAVSPVRASEGAGGGGLRDALKRIREEAERRRIAERNRVPEPAFRPRERTGARPMSGRVVLSWSLLA